MIVRDYQVESIHCEGCVASIRSALEAIDGIAEAHPKQPSNRVTIQFDEAKVNDEVIAAALVEAGFPVIAIEDRDTTSRAGRAEQSRRGATTEEVSEARRRKDGGFGPYAILAAAVVVIAVAGYTGYVLYPRFDLPAVEGLGLLGLAAAAGVASFFSPCSFPLLVGLLGRQAVEQTKAGRSAQPAVFGGSLALGAAVFLLLAGVVIALGGEALFAGVTFTSPAGITIRIVVGVALITLGLIQTGILRFSLHGVSRLAQPIARRQARLRRERPVAGFALFGFGYVLAGFG